MQEEYGSHVSRDPMRPAHMIIQQKFPCLAAYECHVLKMCELDMKTTASIGLQ